MDHSLDFVEFLGAEGVILGVSSAIQTLGGYDPARLLGTHYQEIIHPEDCARAVAAFDAVLRGEHCAPLTLRYRHQDGSWRTIQASARNFLADPSVNAIVVLTRDVTEQIAAETSLTRANVELRQLSQQLILAQEKERSRIALALHEDVQQILVGLRMTMEPERQAPTHQLPRERVDTWIGWVQQALDHLHALTIALRAPVIGDLGLAAELRAYAERLPLADNQDIHVEILTDIGRLAPAVELACFRIVQESLANAIRHSRAMHLQVRLQKTGHDLCISVTDDGDGFDLNAARARAVETGTIGLLSMRERAAMAGGLLEVKSTLGYGTQVRASFRV
jgi:PAS domain S-box-containing protein